MSLAIQNDNSTPDLDGTAALVQRPTKLSDTGLSEIFVADLLSKHLVQSGSLPLGVLAKRLALPGRIVENVLHFLRKDARVEVLPTQSEQGELRYGLTDRGRVLAATASESSGYAGAAPVPLADYVRLVHAQSVHDRSVNETDMRQAFKDVIIAPDLLNRLGPSLNSGRSIFIYGPAGTGKTYLTQRIGAGLQLQACLIPYAIAGQRVGGFRIRSRSSTKCHRSGSRPSPSLDSSQDADGRTLRASVERPAVVVGGELSEEHAREYSSTRTTPASFGHPCRLKANNGLFIIDDMGQAEA